MPTLTLPNGLKCGCLPSSPVALARRPYLGYYLRGVPPGPEVCQRSVGYKSWGMKLNDRYGCCVVSGKVHKKQAATFVDNEGTINDIPDSEVRRVYLMLSPGDNGLMIDGFLEWCQKQPMPWTLGPFGTIDPHDADTLKKACYWLGGVTLGIGVPDAWGNNVRDGFTWDRVGYFRGVVHDVEAVDYNERGLEIITWGVRGTITWAGLAEQCGEAFATLAPDWHGADEKSPPGLDKAGLASYLAVITGQEPPGPVPEPPQPEPPVPPAPPTPAPDSCDLIRRGLDIVRRAAVLGPDDPRVKTALDWADSYIPKENA